ncbi:hypothetical protein BREVNS_0997 [Brevinematales bacterium NS]|nr:hypothetical protein BREVNS_0997 [Brevinematales bacterium NS]
MPVVSHSYRMVIFKQKLNSCLTIFSFSVLGYFVTHFPSFTKYSPTDKGGVVLVACYACASDGGWAAFASKEKNILSFQGKSFLRGRHCLAL